MVHESDNKTFQRRKEVHIAIVGLGRFGESLALALAELGCQVLGIDRDEVLVNRLSPEIPCIVADATDEDALREVNVPTFDAVVVAIGTDFESNVMATVTLKNLGARYIVCQSAAEYEGKILLRVGADRVVAPEQDAGRQLARELATPGPGERLTLGPGHSVVTFTVPETLAGKSLAQLGQRPLLEITVLAIQRDDESLVQPTADTVLLESDLLVLLGSNEAIASLDNLF